MMQPTPVKWDMSKAYQMVRQRDHALTDRQRLLQHEQEQLRKELERQQGLINRIGDSIAAVEKAGGDATSLREQIAAAHDEVARIKPRHDWLNRATSIIAANLRLLDQAHGALHWLNFENSRLRDFDAEPTVELPTTDQVPA